MLSRGLVLSFFIVFYGAIANPRIQLPEFLEDDQIKRAKPLINEVVLRYERARKEYNKKGPQAFVDSLSDKISADDKKEIVQILAKLPELPTSKVEDTLLYLEFENGKKYDFKISDILIGRIKSGSYSKRYNFNLSPKENLELFNLKEEKKSYSKLLNKSLLFFSELILIPYSHASSVKEGRDAAVISILATVKAHALAPLGFVNYGRPGQDAH